jgi:hypothetical protein
MALLSQGTWPTLMLQHEHCCLNIAFVVIFYSIDDHSVATNRMQVFKYNYLLLSSDL